MSQETFLQYHRQQHHITVYRTPPSNLCQQSPQFSSHLSLKVNSLWSWFKSYILVVNWPVLSSHMPSKVFYLRLSTGFLRQGPLYPPRISTNMLEVRVTMAKCKPLISKYLKSWGPQAYVWKLDNWQIHFQNLMFFMKMSLKCYEIIIQE